MTGRLLQTVLRQAEALAADAGPDAIPDAELLARFARLRDEPAFAALVRRHGPMVWAVCRHLLSNPADAEDAFQATFLALVRSAGKVRAGAAVGAWLHGVAVRAAAKLKRSAVRRKQREERVAGPEADRSIPEGTWDELLAAVHEEVGRLPEALRTAFVLCDLEGVRQPDAAARLGWKLGTLSGRLTKARQRLLARLADRGIAAGAVAIGTAAAGAAVPAGLTGKVLGLTTAATDAVPPAIWELALEVTPMTVNRTKLIAACVLVAGGLGIGVGAAVLPNADAQGPPQPGAPSGAIPSPNVPSQDPRGGEGGAPGGPLPSPDAGGASLPPGAGGELGAEGGFPGGFGETDSPGGFPGGPGGDSGATGMFGGGGMGMMGGGAPASQRWEYQFDVVPGSVDAFRKLVVKRGQDGWEFAGAVAMKGTPASGMPGLGGMPGMPGEMSSGSATQLVFKRPVRSGSGRSGGGMMGPGGGIDPMSGGPMTPGGSGRTGRGGPAGRGGSLDAAGPGMAPGGRGMPGAEMPGAMMPGMPGGMPPQAAGGFQVIALKHADARELTSMLSQLFTNIQAVPDSRTNSLILKADANTSKEIKELIQKLDVAGTAGSPHQQLPNQQLPTEGPSR